MTDNVAGEFVVCADPAISDSQTVTRNFSAVEYALESWFPSFLAEEFVCDFQLGEGRRFPVSAEIIDAGKSINLLG